MTCVNCGANMIPMLQFFVCSAECDLKKSTDALIEEYKGIPAITIGGVLWVYLWATPGSIGISDGYLNTKNGMAYGFTSVRINAGQAQYRVPVCNVKGTSRMGAVVDNKSRIEREDYK